MMDMLTDKMEKVEIMNVEDYYPIQFALLNEEVQKIFTNLMASETDKSEKTQCRCAVIANVTFHSRSRRRHGNCYNACEPLKIAARLAFEHRLEDPALGELFHALYECNGSFAELLHSCYGQGDIEYFLDQSTRLKLLFPVQNEKKPMLECPLNRTYSTFRPIEGAIDSERFDDLELMIRYGACLDYQTAFGDDISVAHMALDLLFKCYNPEMNRLIDKPVLPEYLRFLRLILRAVPRVTYPMAQQFRSQSMFACPTDVTDNKRAMFDMLQREGIVSAAHGGKEPASLKHLARLAARKQLYRAWQLPRGIYLLGLPKRLEEYLDLQAD